MTSSVQNPPPPTGPRTVVMVDVYAPTMRLARAFADAGCAVVRVRSTPEIPAVYQGHADPAAEALFVDTIVHSGDVESTGKAVADHDPVAVVTGGELGVELADRLSETLGLTSNGTRHSAARRDKYRQIAAVRAAGLPTARQLLVTDADELDDWHRELGARVVVKPVRSAGNDGVAFCDTPAESVAAYRAVAGARNIFSLPNDAVVAQEYLAGTEYVVNTVSRDGRHRATDVWRYTKISANGVRDRISGAVLVAPDAPVRDTLVRYAAGVLDALDVRHGPAHHEIMLTADGPRLVEVGVRLCGADTAAQALLALGESQVERTVQAYLDPAGFLAAVDDPQQLRRHVAMAFLTAPVTGTLRGYPLLDRVRELESLHEIQIGVRPGQRLPLTVDDTTEPMMVVLAHPRAEVVERDLATVGWLDGYGFYDLEPETTASAA
ncbi:ATP-grasp domain-containing protein [Micromonospora sp. NBRC 101691]|uniref:ATP-grasp domain-containing protein n=1 Tax=Micromonospora sp. NBRC 101691 TaxID=3032198 RepID=UPI0024A2CBEF|nr:ATP-grasp domain-containing protein [Micromonospora sp. NBRC 101691]GLY25189.1 ATP-grasp domain-containing protein [Micromonospora sp. NBRC 101691]